MITNSNHILKAGVANINISDHQLVYFLKKKSKENPTKISFQGRSYIDYDFEQFSMNLNQCDWNVFGNHDDPNVLWHVC